MQHLNTSIDAWRRARVVWIFFIILLLPKFSHHSVAQEQPAPVAGLSPIFNRETVTELRLRLNEKGAQNLRTAPREYTKCELIENDNAPIVVSVKLKGAAGSYRDFDDRPGLTLNVDRHVADQRFHGMKKFHLNNAVQDESYLSEWLGSEFFREGGMDVPRVDHVRLWINDRDLGLYVLREGFDSPYLKRRFGESKGHLYDGGFVQDIDSELELDSGESSDPHKDLIALAVACFQPDPHIRQQGISERLDLDSFLTFMALERICGHWDGYSLNKNNYRIYFPTGGKAIFLPHGMDQLFGDPDAGLFDHSSALLAAAVLQSDAWRARYQQRLKELAFDLPNAEAWMERIDRIRQRLQVALQAMDSELAANQSDRVEELKDRLVQRLYSLPRLIEELPMPSDFDRLDPKAENTISLELWDPVMESEHMQLEEVDIDGVSSYFISRELFGDYVGSWRCSVLLPRGHYRLEARVKLEDVIPIPDDPAGGVGIRRIPFGRTEGMFGSHDWTLISDEIEIVADQRLVEWKLEIRARHGKAWFDRESIQLRRIPTR